MPLDDRRRPSLRSRHEPLVLASVSDIRALDEELVDVWTMTLQPTMNQRRRIDARVFEWVEARDTSLAAEWLSLFKIAPFSAVGLVTVSTVALATTTPLIWLARALL